MVKEKFKDNSNVTIQTGDMMNVFRIAYMDRVDNGNRQEAFLSGLPQTEWTGDVNFRMFGCVGSVMFFKHLILSIVFQNSIMSLGRPEMNFIMPPFLYTVCCCQYVFLNFFKLIIVLILAFDLQQQGGVFDLSLDHYSLPDFLYSRIGRKNTARVFYSLSAQRFGKETSSKGNNFHFFSLCIEAFLNISHRNSWMTQITYIS